MPRFSTDGDEQLVPAVTSSLNLGQQVSHRHRRRDVLPGLLGLAELVGGNGPTEQHRHRVLELLDDERLDDVSLDVPKVDEQLSKAPALQFVCLDVERR